MPVDKSTCQLCRELKELKRSHILPDALFRSIKRQNSGKLISFDDSKDTSVKYSSESWWEYLLCSDCEGIISGYEKFGLEMLRRMPQNMVQSRSRGLTIQNVDYPKFKLFATSLIWRAAVSDHDAFTKVVLPDSLAEEARSSLIFGKPLNSFKLGCKIARLFDETLESEGGFSNTDIKQLIISPIPRIRTRYVSFIFVIEGYLLEFFVPAIPFNESTRKGFLKNAKVLYIPNKNIFEIEELVNIMVSGYRKADLGMVTFRE
jgi:hypothetical protein